MGFTADNPRVPRGLTPATGTGSSLPFLPVKTCGCGRYALVGRQRTCDECKSDRNRERMQQRRGTLNPLPRLQLPAFSKYTEHQLFRCQALTTKGTQCKSPRPHGSPVCVVHRGER